MVQELKEKDEAALREQVIRMAREAGLHSAVLLHIYGGREGAMTDGEIDELRRLERFADLVAKRAVSNIDPASSMSYQEGYAAGAAAEREECAKVCDEFESEADPDAGSVLAAAIRARGEK